MEFKDVKDTAGIQWTDVSSEQYRIYEFKDKQLVRIDNPLALNVSKGGGHRLVDAQGKSHYVPKGWIHLEWKVFDGQPHFVK